jgi:hypothetical protein
MVLVWFGPVGGLVEHSPLRWSGLLVACGNAGRRWSTLAMGAICTGFVPGVCGDGMGLETV